MHRGRLKIETSIRQSRNSKTACVSSCLLYASDKVYEYEGQSEIPKMYVARATEEETYDYIISECNAVADYFLNDVVDPMSNIHAARATKWAALALKARAAIYAG